MAGGVGGRPPPDWFLDKLRFELVRNSRPKSRPYVPRKKIMLCLVCGAEKVFTPNGLICRACNDG